MGLNSCESSYQVVFPAICQTANRITSAESPCDVVLSCLFSGIGEDH